MTSAFVPPQGEAAIRYVQRLRTRAFREKSGQVIVEGAPEVRRAMQAGVGFDALYVCPELIALDSFSLDAYPVVEVDKATFADMAFGTRLKGILAICRPDVCQWKDLSFSVQALVMILEGVEKPGNLGGVLRTCDGAGVNAVVMCEGKTDIYNQHVVRSSIGTVFTVPTVALDRERLFEALRDAGFRIYAASAHAGSVYTDVTWNGRAAVVLGNEHDGVSSFWQERADQTIAIPMKGAATSLNVAASAAVIAYEALRQRSGAA